MLFVDIGANDGYEIAHAMKEGFEVVAFEPNLQYAPLLNYFATQGAEIIYAAAWDKDGEAEFYLQEGESQVGASLIKEKTNVKQEGVMVPTVCLGCYLKQLDKDVEVLKIDAEGAAYRIIESVLDHFDYRRIKHWWVEDHEKYIVSQEWSEHKQKVLKRINELGINLDDWIDWGTNYQLLG